LVAQDVGQPRKNKADISALFDLIDEGPESDIARDKDRMIGEAVCDEYRRATGRKRRRPPRAI
jgi:hypothetical protein